MSQDMQKQQTNLLNQATQTQQNNNMSNEQLIHKGDGLQVVIGLGQSGLSTVKYLHQQGYQVAVTDGNPNPSLASQLPADVSIRQFGQIDGDLLQQASRIIISPGVALSTPQVAQARQQGIPVVSDIQLFCDVCHIRQIPIVAITGSNAKSTVTTLVGQMAKDAGIHVGVGGNIGIPALNLLADENMALAVLELSSFQLETVSNLNAQVATVLNMSPDHLDRHGDMLGYHQAKHRIFQGVKSIVTNREDALSRPLVADDLPRISVGQHAPDKGQYGLVTQADGTIYLARGSDLLLSADELLIKGQHNLINALSALAIGELAGLPQESMLNTLRQFTGLPHRCQFVAQVAGVDYFNDSKGTNIGSTMAAIQGLGMVYAPQQGKLVLILGGQGKGQQFTELVPLINKYVSHVLLIGEDAALIESHLTQAKPSLSDGVQLQHCQTLAQALQTTKGLLADEQQNNSTTAIKAVLLSPACASFDQFSGYVQRGEQFAKLVHELAEEVA